MRLSVWQWLCICIVLLMAVSLFGSVKDIKNRDMKISNVGWEPVEHALGKNGTMLPGGVFMVSLPRNDIDLMIGDVQLKPAFGLDSWVAFMDMGDGAMMMGDLVLTGDEIWSVQKRIQQEGIDITAIHNTLIGETPNVFDLHIGGQGDPVVMAKKVHDALSLTNMSYNSSKETPEVSSSIDHSRLDRVMGYNGILEDGIYKYDVPRAEKIIDMGMEIPPTMDVATMIKFQPLGGERAAITGDFILVSTEVNPVIRALNDNDIKVVALHSHMLTEEPRMFFMHFWATGNAYELAQGIHEAISRTNSTKPNIPITPRTD
ncbi:hypothetical protein CUJ83_07075 [Methanocella sp. CWC-04]|uniref:DUF1259 domain-containing protein n=1 Tax=Methanooceanicella nereidis TaxID=2052831 RepID=A0AAP2RCI0_9EURY|nr:LppY/LpqO family protein [Methanocella sp. CWC-04]MCD1294759.1 hypothetical protein [Methanocella sp. CWC-04]